MDKVNTDNIKVVDLSFKGKVILTDEFTTDQLNEALYHLVDVCDRCLIPFVLLNETARSIIQDNSLKGERVSIGVREADMTGGAKSTLKTLASSTYDINLGIKDFEELDNGYMWNYKGIPISIQVIKRTYGFITNPDYTFYWGEQYNVPNPFAKYWQTRSLVK